MWARVPLLIGLLGLISAYGCAEVQYPIDDFDDQDPRNDFFGLSGTWADGQSSAIYAFAQPGADGSGRCLHLKWRVEPRTVGCGWWMDLGPRWDNAEPQRDISWFEQIGVLVRGTGFGEGARLFLQLQFADGTAEELLVPGPREEWTPVRWRLVSLERPQRPKAARRLAFVIVPRSDHPAEGELFVDELTVRARPESARPPESDEGLLELIARRTCEYFIDGQHPHTGLVWDTASDWRRSSVAACGFGLAALCIAAEHDWLSRAEAAERAERMLGTLLDASAGSRVHGFFYHFLDTSTGHPLPGSEVSSVDTAILAAGAICAKEYFDRPQEASLRELCDKLYREIEWPWLLDDATGLFWMGWRDGQRLQAKWDWYTDEALLICLLAAASPAHPAPDQVMWAWKRPTSGDGLSWDAQAQRLVSSPVVYSWTGSLFTYFAASLWCDLRGWRDRHPVQPVDWWENSRRAALANVAFCRRWFKEKLGWETSMWGASACIGPNGYGGSYGAPPCGEPEGPVFDGTVTPAAPAMALPALPLPKLGLDALRQMFDNTRLWGVYGLRDGFNPGQSQNPYDDWVAHDYVGINEGYVLLGIENYRSGLIWQLTSRNGSLADALRRLFTR
ncbi:MAG: hypothetical protein H5T86_12870 [Armatimonadetes bacterium]|nr:hypothetical protein [Armatimonadota bacterium]